MNDVAARDPFGPAGARLARWSGPAAVAVSAVGILLATVLAPWFSWTGNALSDLGAAGADTALLFNGTLVLAGVLGTPFALFVLRCRSAPLRRVGTGLFAAAMPMLALVGVFPLPSPSHGPVAVAFFGLFTIGLLVDGVGAVRAGDRDSGLVSIGLGMTHVLGWIAWAVAGLAGIALPEMVGTVVLWLWVLGRFRELPAHSSPSEPVSSSSRPK